MKLRFGWLAVGIVIGVCAGGYAQVPFEPASELTAPPAQPKLTPQMRSDIDWLTSYLVTYEGYRFQDVPALEQKLDKMSPTQLQTLRKLYEEKYAMEVQRAAAERHASVRQAEADMENQQPTLRTEQQQLQQQQPQQEQQAEQPTQRLGPQDEAWAGAISTIRIRQMKNMAEANEQGELIEPRQLPGFRNDPFGEITGRPFGFGAYPSEEKSSNE